MAKITKVVIHCEYKDKIKYTVHAGANQNVADDNRVIKKIFFAKPLSARRGVWGEATKSSDNLVCTRSRRICTAHFN